MRKILSLPACANRRRAVAPAARAFSGCAPVVTSAQIVKELRDITGSSIGQCRKALIESENDLDKALDWLKKRNVVAAKTRWEKLEDGALPEGLIAMELMEGKGCLVRVGAETDFVVKNEIFQRSALECAANILHDLGDRNKEMFEQLSAKVGETVRLMSSVTLMGPHVVGYYWIAMLSRP